MAAMNAPAGPVPADSIEARLPADPTDPRWQGRALYWQGWRLTAIARHLGVNVNTVMSWKRRGEWDKATSLQKIEATLELRLVQLIAKDVKEGRDFKEIDLLHRQLERSERIRRYREGGNETDLNPKVANRNAGPKKRPEKNAFTDEQIKALHDAFLDSIFEYQRVWFDAGQKYRIRDLLKSRQIGATWYFAREALDDALRTGRNQIFLSASKAQAYVFRQYIIEFAREVCDVELKGDPMVLPNGATLYFLGTNARTAQSYHGNLYFDEIFWVPRFAELRKVASGMAIHKKWRQTYFSTPSATSHEAYPFWTGALYNRGRKKEDRVEIDVSHEALRGGLLCADGQWRQIVTVEDAIAGGCDLFDIEQLRLEYGPEEFANLLMCMFLDDSMSAFPLAQLQLCMVDSWEVWADFKPFAARPFGSRGVWIGYDPSHTGDAAGLVVVAPPLVAGGPFRILERHQLRGGDFEAQAEFIRKITDRYWVTHIAIDNTGLGAGVFQLVRKFFPAAVPINYSVDQKVRMVLKAQNVISRGRLQFDAGWTDIAQSFMAIRKVMTQIGNQMTFDADRSEDASHADLAWATMHCLINEPLEGQSAQTTSSMEIFG